MVSNLLREAPEHLARYNAWIAVPGSAFPYLSHSEAEMKAGDRVVIYRDPVTKILPEGPAILIERLPGNPHHVEELEVWLVKMETGEERVCYLSPQAPPRMPLSKAT